MKYCLPMRDRRYSLLTLEAAVRVSVFVRDVCLAVPATGGRWAASSLERAARLMTISRPTSLCLQSCQPLVAGDGVVICLSRSCAFSRTLYLHTTHGVRFFLYGPLLLVAGDTVRSRRTCLAAGASGVIATAEENEGGGMVQARRAMTRDRRARRTHGKAAAGDVAARACAVSAAAWRERWASPAAGERRAWRQSPQDAATRAGGAAATGA
jgi:hypothetical protein